MFDPSFSFRLLGLRLSVRASVLLVLAVVLGGVVSRPSAVGGPSTLVWGVTAAGTIAVVTVLLVGHESLRVWWWRRSGVVVRRVELHLYGGSAEVLIGPASPRVEATGALAALGVVAAIGGGLIGAAVLTRGASAALHTPIHAAAVAGAAVAIVQAMPAPPLDGGRILHAWCWQLFGDQRLASRATGIYGHLVAVSLVGIGLLLLGREGESPFWGLAAAVAGFQVEGASRRAIRRPSWLAAGSTATVGEARRADLPEIAATATLGAAVERFLSVPREPFLLVLDERRAIVGLMAPGNLRGSRRADWERRVVADVMTPVERLPRFEASTAIADAIVRLDGNDSPIALQTDGEIVGIVTAERLMAWAEAGAASR